MSARPSPDRLGAASPARDAPHVRESAKAVAEEDMRAAVAAATSAHVRMMHAALAYAEAARKQLEPVVLSRLLAAYSEAVDLYDYADEMSAASMGSYEDVMQT